jgi:hypothetical protein
VIATMTVISTNPTQETLPKPGQGVRRVIIQVDPTPGHQAQLRLNQGAPITIETGIQLVLDVV